MIPFFKRLFLDQTAFLGAVRGFVMFIGGLFTVGAIPLPPRWIWVGPLFLGAAGAIRSSSATAQAAQTEAVKDMAKGQQPPAAVVTAMGPPAP